IYSNCLFLSRFVSPGSVVVIVLAFIALVVLVLGGVYYYKFRGPSYGRLMESSEYGTLGNFSNPIHSDHDSM
uniref:Uncharacterized protein n=2 Tax=Amphiprion TaxID=80969 RepID=A0AAQ5Y993_AMPOC